VHWSLAYKLNTAYFSYCCTGLRCKCSKNCRFHCCCAALQLFATTSIACNTLHIMAEASCNDQPADNNAVRMLLKRDPVTACTFAGIAKVYIYRVSSCVYMWMYCTYVELDLHETACYTHCTSQGVIGLCITIAIFSLPCAFLLALREMSLLNTVHRCCKGLAKRLQHPAIATQR
jgi:hypothetical protein